MTILEIIEKNPDIMTKKVDPKQFLDYKAKEFFDTLEKSINNFEDHVWDEYYSEEEIQTILGNCQNSAAGKTMYTKGGTYSFIKNFTSASTVFDDINNLYDTFSVDARRYLDIKNPKYVCDRMIRAALGSVADTAIIPMQDYLKLGGEARMNVPSTLGTNWKWRMKKDALTPELAKHMYKYAKMFGRL